MVELRCTQSALAQAKGAALVDALLVRAWQAGHAHPCQNTCIARDSRLIIQLGAGCDNPHPHSCLDAPDILVVQACDGRGWVCPVCGRAPACRLRAGCGCWLLPGPEAWTGSCAVDVVVACAYCGLAAAPGIGRVREAASRAVEKITMFRVWGASCIVRRTRSYYHTGPHLEHVCSSHWRSWRPQPSWSLSASTLMPNARHFASSG